MAIGIGIGLGRFPLDRGPDYFKWIAQCEAGGIDSIWQTDRLISKEPNLETLSTMAALAGATEKIRFGMNVASIALRDPLLTAKQCATIDFLSGGRLLPAFGIGSALSRDYSATGTPTKGRGKKADEALHLLQQLWTKDEVSFEGEYFQYDRASISPKPANPRLPLWIGGTSQAAIERTARVGTGWLAGIDTPSHTKTVVAGIKAALPKYKRTIDEDHYGATFSFRFGSVDEPIAQQSIKGLQARLKQDPVDYLAIGSAEDVSRRLEEFIDAGCSKFVLIPIAEGTRDLLNQTERLIQEVLPRFD
ncbi:MAG: LLM class flavin-dependent oxidoreductase [Pseudomonadales bacterium]|jgi:probable F420-dependent oxidoreductase|nr:LLM class flavin-dependent oxidoreductase [Pseudomonadales bacterium]